MRYRLLFASIVAAALFAGCSKEEHDLQPQTPATTTLMDAGSVYKGTVMVKMKVGEGPLTKSETNSLSDLGIYSIKRMLPHNEKYAARHKKAGLDRWYVVSFNPEVSVARVHNEFSRMGEVETVDYVPVIKTAQATATFNDPYLSHQWHYYKEGSDIGINLKKAWEITTGREDVIVAVLDGGIDYRHDDLKDAMWKNSAEVRGDSGYDDDGNGYVDDIYGYNFSARGNAPAGTILPGDHGTHVAGTVAAVNNNGKFGAGVAGGNGTKKGARLMCCQILDEYADGTFFGLAYIYAADNGAVITQNSWGFENATETPTIVLEGIAYFNRYAGMDASGEKQVGPMAGGVTIFSAGNNNTTADYPGMEENIIAVSATGPTGLKASYSNYGEWVDIAAPGGDNTTDGSNGLVLSTIPNNQFAGMGGTSMACPHVSGVAALIVSKFGGPGFTNEQLTSRLLKSADEEKLYSINETYRKGKKLGAGMLDAYAALLPGTIPEAVTTVEATVKSNFITVKWDATATEEFPTAGYKIFWHTGDLSNFNPSDENADAVNSTYVQSNAAAGTEITHTFAVPVFDKDVYIRIQAMNALGDGSALSDQVKVHTYANNAPAFEPAGDITVSLKPFDKKEYEFTVSDPDDHKIAGYCTFAGGSDAATSSQVGNKVTVSIDAAKASPGTYKAVISAKDEYDLTGNVTITYTILPNTPPAVVKTIGNMVIGKGESVTLDLNEYFTDADGEKLKFTAESTESSIADFGIVDNTFGLSGRAFGETTITVTAADAKKESAKSSFTILVRDNKVPVDIYPNPAKDYVNVRAGSDGTYAITVIGAQGGEVYANSSVSTGPFNPYKIDVSEWSAGVYTIIIKGGGKEYTTTIVKL